MNFFSSFLIFKTINNFLIILFFFSSVYLFSGVSAMSKSFLFVILFFLFFNNLYIMKVFKKNISLQNNDRLFFIFLSFLTYLLINTFFLSKVPFESKFEFLNFILYFISFYIFSVIDRYELEKILQIVFFLILSSFFSFYFIFGEKIIYFFVYNPNIFSGYCLVVFLFSFFSFRKNFKLSFFPISNLLLSLTFLIFFKNLTSLFIVLFFLIFSFFKKKYLILIIFGLCLLGLLAVVFNFSSFFDRLIWIFIGLKVWLDNFITGVGLGNFKFFYQKYSIGLPSTSTATLFVHNYFLHILTELGILGGILLFLIFFFSFFIEINKENKIFIYPILGILFQNLVDYNLIIPQNGVLFFSFLGLVSKSQTKNTSVLFLFKNLIIVFLIVYGIYNSFKLSKVINLLKEGNFKESVKLEKTCWYAYRKIAESDFYEKNFERAEEYFLKAIRFNPLDADSYLYLSTINFKKQRKKQGYEYFKKAIILNPKAAKKYKDIIDKEKK